MENSTKILIFVIIIISMCLLAVIIYSRPQTPKQKIINTKLQVI